MKKLPLFFIVSTLLVLIYFTFAHWQAIDNYLDKESGYIQAVAAILGIMGSIFYVLIRFLWKKEDKAASQDLQAESPTKQGMLADTQYEATPLDNSIDIDAETSPYLGLNAFKPEDAHLFFGRRREIREALSVLGRPLEISDALGKSHICRWLQIEGNSGAGKSSLVNAGLLPAIEQGKLASQTGYQHWKIIKPIMPGETPLKRLAEALEYSFKPEGQRDTLACQKKLESDERALAYMLNDFKSNEDSAFVLFVDQFEELFTFADKQEKQQFDAQVANAIQDKDCPLFLISTVRIDFLEGFEQLPKLSELYNSYCKRYLLKTISLQGLQEAIEKPAKIAKLDVSEITTALLKDAQNEVGALPLVENALQVLWQQRQSDKLRGDVYLQKGGLVGLLEEQADALLDAVDKKIPKGEHSALELLLELTRINDEGRHTRRNIPIGRACLIAGGKKADKQRGLQIIDYLTGRQAINAQDKNKGRLRLLTTIGEKEQEQQVSIIHETLIRARGKDKTTGKLVGYWKTLYDYIEKNRDRGFYIDQLERQAKTWSLSKGITRWQQLASWRDLKNYKSLRLEKDSLEAKFKRQSQIKAGIYAGLLAIVLGFIGEAYYWTYTNGMPPSYMLMQQKFRLMNWGMMDEPLPEMSNLITPENPFVIGDFGEMANASLKSQGSYNRQNFGYPSKTVQIPSAFYIGKYEISYKQYDYYVWQQRKQGKNTPYPAGAKAKDGNNRGQLAVTQVSWLDANTYTHWLSKKTGDQYRLPTEAEWEYAARGKTKTAYWWGDKIGTDKANCKGCSDKEQKLQQKANSQENVVSNENYVTAIGSFPQKNEQQTTLAKQTFGLYDTAGNVWEWTCSEWKVEYNDSNSESHCVTASSGPRVIRGGSWLNTSEWLRSSARTGANSVYRGTFVGFRIYRSARTN